MKANTPTSTATAERRSARRQNIIQSATLYTENAPVMTPGSLVQVNNISTSGISFESRQASDEGSICRVMINTESLRLNSRVRIIRCEKSAEQFTIGAEFVEELPDWTPADN
jgi:PilZ domain